MAAKRIILRKREKRNRINAVDYETKFYNLLFFLLINPYIMIYTDEGL